MTIADMREGRQYNVEDGYGYEVVTCVQAPHGWDGGVRVQVRYESGELDWYWEASGWLGNHVYVEELPSPPERVQ